RGQRPPAFVAVEDPAVLLVELFGGDRVHDQLANLLRSGPDVPKVDGAPVGGEAQRFAREVDVDLPGQGVGHAQRRRGQVAGTDLRVDAALEVPVSRQDGDHHQVALLHGRRDVVGQGTRVPDAGG